MTRFATMFIFSFLLFAALCRCGEEQAPVDRDSDSRRTKFIRDFEKEDSIAEWLYADGANTEPFAVDAEHGTSLKVNCDFPGVTKVWRGSRENPKRLVVHDPFSGKSALILDTLQYQIYIPPENLQAGARIQSRVLLKNKDGLWFEGLGMRRVESGWVRANSLYPGWNTIRIDLSENSTDLRPRGHAMRWSRLFLSQVVAFGLAIQGDKEFKGSVYVDNITTWPATDDDFQKLSVVDFDAGQSTVGRYEKAEFTFSINRPLLNPFSSKEVTIDAVFKSPAGEEIRVPAFYYQDYNRVLGNDNGEGTVEDVYIPKGPGVFKVRFTPRLAGEYTYYLDISYRSPVVHKLETLRTEPRSLTVTEAEKRGFVRISEKDPRCFEFENGDYFFPVGHSLRSPVDERHVKTILEKHYKGTPAPVDRGLRVYEDILPVMKNAGVNAFEVWMSSWWLGIEWTGRWKNYHGLGVYNMEHAWKLDSLVNSSAANDIYIHLVIDNHGKASQEKVTGQREGGQVDHEWEHSPYSTSRARDEQAWAGWDNGFLKYSKDLFRSNRAREAYKDKIRYIAARWGWSTHIYGIEMWSELDLIGNLYGRRREVYASDDVHEWHKIMTGVLDKYDHGRHLVTTHYSGDYSYIDQEMVRLPFIDYIVCDAYHSNKDPLLNMLQRTENFCLGYDKPFQITEFGGDWNASSIEGLDGDLYAGLWWGWMSRSAGTPYYWWFEYLALANHYPAFKALSKYIEGEDKRRGKNEPQLRSQWPMDFDGKMGTQKRLNGLCLGDGKIFYVYVYDKEQVVHLPKEDKDRRVHTKITAKVLNVPVGKYAVEIWDCWTGEIIEKKDIITDATGTLATHLPDFKVHTALKIRWKENAAPVQPKPEEKKPEPQKPEEKKEKEASAQTPPAPARVNKK
ncbi:MAG: DUF5060 domain-containing protein [Planctomycetes bacterium]|nr:DUF5060 domain-containing protein [Planctomycetota bacterium]